MVGGLLQAKPDRTLIYVGRDFDAAPWYWRRVLLVAGLAHANGYGSD